MLKSGASWRHALYTLVQFPWAVFSFSVAVSLDLRLGAADLPAVVLGVPGVRRRGRHPAVAGDAHHSVYLDNPFEITVTALIGLVFTRPRRGSSGR